MKSKCIPYLFGGVLPALTGCQSAMNQAEVQRPNIIWITCEDISPFMGAYGNEVVKTPNIDQLAREGMRFTNMFTCAGVSSPSRAGIITGMYPTSVGTHHMRTLLSADQSKSIGVPPYSAVLPDYVKAFPEYLRRAGYFTSNNQKTDYQFEEPVTVWDECSSAADYSHAPEGKPLFSVYNLFITHESQTMVTSKHFEQHPELLISPDQVSLPPYLPDTELGHETMARMLSNVQLMDWCLGQIIQRLKDDGLYDNSYIFFFSDHGGNLPWTKREILERGTHIPFVVKYPKGEHAGEVCDDLISSVDLAPTVLSLVGIEIPDHLQGQAFLGSQASKDKRKYVYAGRDRMDEVYDRVRSVRDKQYRYLRNFMPDRPKYMDLVYRKGMAYMREILDLHQQGKLNDYQEEWFKPTKPVEELYDVVNDPDELHNLAEVPAYSDKLAELRGVLQTWLDEVGDMAAIPEKEMLRQWWNGADTPPSTATPQLVKTKDGYQLTCDTKGTSIGYKILAAGEEPQKVKIPQQSYCMMWTFGVPNGTVVEVDTPWNVYSEGEAITLQPGQRLLVNARRIGYQPVEMIFDID